MKKLLLFLALLCLFGLGVNATQIVVNATIQSRDTATCTTTPPPDPFYDCVYACSLKFKVNLWNAIPLTRITIESRENTFFTGISLPSTAVIEKVEVRQYTVSETLPLLQFVQFKKGNLNATCKTEFSFLATSTFYTEKGQDYFTVGAYYDYVDLGSNAVSELQSHLTYFYLGEKLKNGSGFIDESWDGSIEWQIHSQANPPQLRITYHLLPSEADAFEEGLVRHYNWFYPFCGIMAVCVLLYFVLKGD